MEKIKKKETTTYESIIAGLLLKFTSINNIDFSLLIADFKNKTKIDTSDWWYKAENIGKYVNYSEKFISLRDGLTLDSRIEEGTLKEKLIEVAGSKVMDYIDSLDVEQYRVDKEKKLEEHKKCIINDCNVLLISDIQNDYDELIKYGFKNVDYFKSIVRASAYFDKHPEELQKYHLILNGNQSVHHCCIDEELPLEITIEKLESAKNILVTNLYVYEHFNYIKLVSYMYDNINNKRWDIEESSYYDIYDRIVENMLINHVFENVDTKNKEFNPIEDSINPNRFLPTKKSDLKILYLCPVVVNDFTTKISEKFNLNITFEEDSNSALGKNKTHLGDYDIVIVSHMYSNNILFMNHESTEQCKDTGRELTLFVSQEDEYWGVNRDIADGVKINYTFGGNIAPDSQCHNKTFRVLRQNIEVKEDDKYWTNYNQSAYSKMRALIESSVNIYNQALIQMDKPAISDIDFKTAEDFDREYVKTYEYQEALKEAELAPIRLFDKIKCSVSNYLWYKKKGYINSEGLNVIEGEDCIKVEINYQGQTLCTLIFPCSFKNNNLRIFKIQTMTKKGTLSNPQMVGLYTSEYDNLENKPPRPDEKQMNALISIEKKLNVILKPLNEDTSFHPKQEVSKHIQRLEKKLRKNN